MAEIRKQLLGEIATYVEGRLERQVLEDAKGLTDRTEDGVVSLIAGIVQVQVLEERWTGAEYWMKAELRVDPAKVQADLEQMVNARRNQGREGTQNAQASNSALAERELAEIRRLLEAQRLGSGGAPSTAANDSLQRLEARIRELESRKPANSAPTGSAVANSGLASLESQVTAEPFASDLLNDIPVVEEDPNIIAVIIGNSRYRGEVPPAKFAANDAAVVRAYAERALGIRPGNIFLLNDASKSQLEQMFGAPGNPNGRLRNVVRRGVSDVFVFYSGHGAVDAAESRAFIVPADAEVSLLSLTGYPLDLLFENLAALGGRHVTVVLDAAFSGATGGGEMLVRNASPIGLQVRDPRQWLQNRSATLILASEGQQLANWFDDKQHGLLTYYFLKGLQGDADGNGDGTVTVAEMRAYLNDPTLLPYEARRLHGRDQTPLVFGADDYKLRQRPRSQH